MSKKLALLSKYGLGSDPLGTIQHDYDDDRERVKKDKKKKKKKSKKNAEDKERGATALMKDMDEMDPVPQIAVVDDADNSGDNYGGIEDNVEDGPTVVEMNIAGDQPYCDLPSGNEVPRSRRETKRRRKRHDSEEDEPKYRHSDDDDFRSEGRRRRHDSDDDGNGYHSKRKSRRHDSDDDGDESLRKERRERKYLKGVGSRPRGRWRRHDSDSSSSPPGSRSHGSRIQRHESDEDSDNSSIRHRRKKNRSKKKNHYHGHESDTASEDEEDGTRSMKMSSGHSAGLQSTSQFRKAEASLQRKRLREAKIISEQSSGRSSETTYRDKHGRKITKDDELSRQQEDKKGQIKIDEKEQLEWGKGRAQIQAEEQAMMERRIVQNESFARFKDDERLEQERKELIRKEDPMALQAYKRQTELRAGRGDHTKHVYKGPQPKPNRFGILPGYRWDGVDRGNGFEDKVLAAKYSRGRKKEDAYRWSAADM